MMLLTIVVVFIGAFSVVALLISAMGQGNASEAKQVLATLDSALATETPEVRDQLIDLRKNETHSAIPWFNQKLGQMAVTPKLSLLLQQANMTWTPGKLIVACLTGFGIPFWLVYMKFANLLIATPVGLAIGFIPFSLVMMKRKKRFSKFVEGLPEAMDLMVSGLRAGHSLVAAMGVVGRECADPVGGEFKACFEEQNYGLELKSALDNMITRMPIQDLRIVATAIMIQKESGGNLAEVLDKTSHVIRERFRLRRQVGVHTAQGRMTGIILSAMPVVLGFMFFFIDPKMMSVLWTDPVGIKLLWGGIILQVLGALLIRKIVDIDI